MTFEEYQKASRHTVVYPNAGKNFIYPTLGLAGEVGEVVEKIKKAMRDKDYVIDDAYKMEIGKEMGDVLWYIAQLSTELGLSLEDIVRMNMEKLQSRAERGMLHGDGDNR